LIKETDAAGFLDFVGYRGICKTCKEPIWWIKSKKNNLLMYLVTLEEHKHSTPKLPVKKMLEQEKRSPGGETGFKNYF
jgi:hypothetical protein